MNMGTDTRKPNGKKPLDVNALHLAGELPEDMFEATEPMGPPPLVPLADLLQPAIDRARARREGREKPIPVTHPERAECLGGGYWPGVHYVIAGTGAGKSQLVIEDILTAAVAGVPCMYVGLELDGFQVALRFLAEQAAVSWSKLYTGRASEHQIALAEREVAATRCLPLFVDFAGPGGWPVTRLRQVLELLRAAHPSGPICLVLDYLQLVAEAPKAQRQELRERIGQVAYAARFMSVEFNAVIVIVSSTARANYSAMAGETIKAAGINITEDGEHFGPRKVVFNPDLLVGLGKESGEIEASADSVTVLLKWPSAYEGQRIVLSVTAKGRATGPGWCALLFDHGTRFLPFAVTSMDDLPAPPETRRGRPKTDDAEDIARINSALIHDPSIASGRRLLQVMQEIGLGGNASRIRSAWKNHPANPNRVQGLSDAPDAEDS